MIKVLKKSGCLSFLLLLMFLISVPCPAATSAGGIAYKEGELILKFKDGSSEESKERVHGKHGHKKLREIKGAGVHHVKVREGATVEDAIQEYKGDPEVEYAEPNYKLKAQTIPSDPFLNDLWGFYNAGQTGGTPGADIKTFDAWSIAKGDGSVVIAVIDTGVELTHQDLANNLWVNNKESNGLPGVDDDGNGYIDDIYGIDTLNHKSAPTDDNGHGSHIAGIIGAEGNNAVGVVGVNWNVKVMACKFLGADGVGYLDGALECLNYISTVKSSGANIVAVNIAWGPTSGTSFPQSLYKAIKAQSDILFVMAAGNSSEDNDLSYQSPSVYDLPNVISVAATDHNDNLAWFSNYGKSTVDIGAPGASIMSTVLNGAYASESGTSMAAAHVAGLAGLVKFQDQTRSAAQIKDLILAGGDSVAALNGKTVTGKRINAYGSLSLSNGAGSTTAQNSNPGATTAQTADQGNSSANTGSTGHGTSQGNSGNNGDQSNKSATQIAGPGWFLGKADLVSHEKARAYFDAREKELSSKAKTSKTGNAVFSILSATDASPEITELARALRYDPKLIYDYVHNRIDYVPYFGSLKGATLTYLDGSGNDFDQASLMIALLRVSGYTAQYVYGTMTISGSNLANWLGVDQMWQTIDTILSSGGIPISNLQYDGTAAVSRVWVKATIGGADYPFDPAFKSYIYSLKIDLGAAMGYNQADLLASATTGATIGTDYVQNLNETNIRAKLATYSNNLVSSIRNQYPNKDIKEVIGGRSIVETKLTQYSTSLPFSATASSSWDNIPASYTTTLRIQHAGIDTTLNIADISGKRLTLTYAGSDNHPELRLDGTLTASGTATTIGSKNNLIITIDHPYAANSGTYMDQTATYTPESGRSYAIVSNFGGISDALLQKRQQQLNASRQQGLLDTSESVLGETLNIMGSTWLKEIQMTNYLLAAIGETVPVMHHNIGLMAQESGYYVDVKTAYTSITSKHNIDADWLSHFKGLALIGSAFEHGMLEQLMGTTVPGVSTIKLLQIASSGGRKVFSANSGNFVSIKPQLINYSEPELTDFQNQVANGNTLILPDNGQLILGQWKGKGYISKKFSSSGGSIGMIIGGNYYGGYASTQGSVSPPAVNNVTNTNVTNNTTPNTISQNITPVQTSYSKDPVDMAGGSFVYEHTDLQLGGSAPLGLSFTRSYNSSLNQTKRNLGYGWSHNYDIYLTPTSHGDPGLGSRQPVDAASFIIALYASLDLLKNNDNIQSWMTASLTAKWAVDQTIDNAVTVKMGHRSMEFIKLPDGSYSSPPGITATLTKNGDGTYRLQERLGTRIDFNTSKKISKMTDVDGNEQKFLYSGELNYVIDSFGRMLIFEYAGGRIREVRNYPPSRSVRYDYDSNDNLTAFFDAEGKKWGYGYDTNHRMTTLTNPLNITTATNTYDSLGRVMTQTVPRKIDGVDTTATYNFYFSGYRNQEVDPAGNALTYYYDEKGREYRASDSLGNSIEKQFDGQNHVISLKDPRSNVTVYEYNGQNNIKKAIDPLSNQIIYDYNSTTSPYSVSDITDSLNRKIHFEYDTKHHLLQTRDDLLNTTSATYNGPKGYRDTATDGRNTVTTFTYDSYGNPATAKTASHPAITYTYDAIGRMTDLTDQVASTTHFDYDKRSLLTTKKDPLLKTTGFTYYSDGKLWTKTDRNNNTITYAYTKSGKLDNIAYPSGSTSFKYNNLDQLTAMQDSLGSTGYTYYANGRLNTVTDANGFTVSYAYDPAGNLTELTYPGGNKVIYTYDAANRMKTVKIDWLNKTATYNYKDKTTDPNDSITTFNGIVTTYTFDNAKRLTGINVNSSPAISYQFTEIDANGNRKAVTQSEPLSAVTTDGTTPYAYNDKKNRLNTAGSNSFGYDNEGQLSSGYGANYTFDYEHRLITAGSNSYYYDGAGRRLKAIRGGVVTTYIYDAAGNLLAEADGNGNITKYYIYGAGLLGMVTSSDNKAYCYHYNATGSTVAMTDSSQTMVNKYAYDPFGTVSNQSETVTQPFKFVGQFGVMTEPNGFYYMRARYYDPNVGRFISEDPIGFDGGDVNVMAYVGNNPAMYIDPDGLNPLLIFAGAKVAAMGIGYVGTKISQWSASYSGANVDTKAVNSALKSAATVSAAQVGAVGVVQGGLAAGYTMLANPQLINNTTDFIEGAISPGPPSSPSGWNYLGSGAGYAYDKYSNNSAGSGHGK